MLGSYMRNVDVAVDNTPAKRNRVVDAWRVVALMFVMFGHWTSASIWVQANGDILAGNTLEWFPAAEHLTWLFQVMPIFFLAGGYANAAALSHDPPDAKTWTTARVRRLFTPVVPLVLVWVGLVFLLHPFVPDNVLYAGTLSATLPLWFIAVYLIMVVASPVTYRWWRRSGLSTVAVLAVLAACVDVVRFRFDIEWIGWVNYVFVWAFVHQLGFAWHQREHEGWRVPFVAGLGAIVVGLGALIATTAAGWYPVSMVTIPGGGISNMTPPTFANGFLAIAQGGLIIATMAYARRLTQRRGVWRFVVAVSAAMMTLYLWHLTALSLLGAAGIFIGGGWLFSFEPGTPTWWLLRIPFFVVLAAITLGLAALFIRFEVRINKGPPPPLAIVWLAGILLAIVAPGAMALEGLITKDATINWWIPIATVGGASLIGAYSPSRRSQTTDHDSPPETG